MGPEQRVLIVEDVTSKYADVVLQLSETSSHALNLVRAENLNQAEDLLMDHSWDLLILDLSMDITATPSLDLGSGHATLAGLDIVERISLMQLQVNTLILTGFDSFQDPDRFDNAIMSMADVDRIAADLIGKRYLGCVRYGAADWKADFQAALARWTPE